MQLEVGAICEGKVTGITNFGVFVEIEKGTTGMVHISEVYTTYVNDINEFVKVGDTVKVKVMGTNENGKISLSMRRAIADAERKERPERKQGFQNREKNFKSDRPAPQGRQNKDFSRHSDFVAPTRSSSDSFEDMMARFKQSSDEKFMDLKRKNGETKRIRRSPKQ